MRQHHLAKQGNMDTQGSQISKSYIQIGVTVITMAISRAMLVSYSFLHHAEGRTADVPSPHPAMSGMYQLSCGISQLCPNTALFF